jgi:hypothetical protein
VGSLTDEAKSAETDRVLARRDHQLAEVRRERDSARQALKNAEAEHDAMAARLALVEQIADLDPRPTKVADASQDQDDRAPRHRDHHPLGFALR